MVQDYIRHTDHHLQFLYDKRARLGKPIMPVAAS
jgi:hypothetical protein